MDRKKFLKTTGVGLGLTLVPGLVQCQSSTGDGDYSDKLVPKVIRDEEGNVLNVIGDIQTHKLFSRVKNGLRMMVLRGLQRPR